MEIRSQQTFCHGPDGVLGCAGNMLSVPKTQRCLCKVKSAIVNSKQMGVAVF